jgi:SAM-dependent methyltransferase
MRAPALRNIFRRHGSPSAAMPAPVAAPSTAPLPAAPAASVSDAAPPEQADWPQARIAAAESLWGEGFLRPGGAEETLLLARPFGLTPAATLLLLGGQGGGPARAIAEAFGCYVASFEADPDLADAATEHLARARRGKRVTQQSWDPRTPALRRNAYHHAIVLEALRGAAPQPILAELATAIRPGGQLSIVDLVADTPLDPADPLVTGWCRLDHRPPSLPQEAMVSGLLSGLGFDVRVIEDVSLRHQQRAMAGWSAVVQTMRVTKPGRRRAAALVSEAELWLFRLRLLHLRRLRLVRWHALRPG